jgi:hypothetical protein
MRTPLHYKNLEEKADSFERKQIKTKKEFADLFDTLLKANDGSIWRGLSESKFKHYTSLQRFWIQHDLENKDEEVEKFLRHIYEYARKWNSGFIDKYFNNYGVQEFSIISAFSILRHHGTPTPLLDWSRNSLIALFFGVSSADINHSNLEIDSYFSLYEMKSSHPYYSLELKDQTYKSLEIQEAQLRESNPQHGSDPEFIDKYVKGYLIHLDFFFQNIKRYPVSRIQDLPDDKFKYFINNNYNITNQEGLFIMNLDPNRPLEEMLFKRPKDLALKAGFSKIDVDNQLSTHKKSLVSYDIHKNLKQYVIKLLNEKGFNDKYIYPELDSLAKDCVDSYMKLG